MNAVMARPLRILYAGGRYHVMSRRNRREAIFYDDSKVKIAQQLRRQTPMNRQWIADRLRIGSASNPRVLVNCAGNL